MTAIEQAAEEKFARRIADHLRRDYAESTVILPDDVDRRRKLPSPNFSEDVLHKLIQSRPSNALEVMNSNTKI